MRVKLARTNPLLFLALAGFLFFTLTGVHTCLPLSPLVHYDYDLRVKQVCFDIDVTMGKVKLRGVVENVGPRAITLGGEYSAAGAVGPVINTSNTQQLQSAPQWCLNPGEESVLSSELELPFAQANTYSQFGFNIDAKEDQNWKNDELMVLQTPTSGSDLLALQKQGKECLPIQDKVFDLAVRQVCYTINESTGNMKISGVVENVGTETITQGGQYEAGGSVGTSYMTKIEQLASAPQWSLDPGQTSTIYSSLALPFAGTNTYSGLSFNINATEDQKSGNNLRKTFEVPKTGSELLSLQQQGKHCLPAKYDLRIERVCFSISEQTGEMGLLGVVENVGTEVISKGGSMSAEATVGTAPFQKQAPLAAAPAWSLKPGQQTTVSAGLLMPFSMNSSYSNLSFEVTATEDEAPDNNSKTIFKTPKTGSELLALQKQGQQCEPYGKPGCYPQP